MSSLLFSIFGYFFLAGAAAGLLAGEFLTPLFFFLASIALLLKSDSGNRLISKLLKQDSLPTKSGWIHSGAAVALLFAAGLTIPADELKVNSGTKRAAVDTEEESSRALKASATEAAPEGDSATEAEGAHHAAPKVSKPSAATEEETWGLSGRALSRFRDKDATAEASVVCREIVKQQLVSPASAKFPRPINFNTWRRDNQSYIIKSYVDSQNAFGATLRSQWHCELQFKPDERGRFNIDSWELKALEII